MGEEEPYQEPNQFISQDETEEPSNARQALVAILGLGAIFALPWLIDVLSFNRVFRRSSQ